jgi:hypothetical protein
MTAKQRQEQLGAVRSEFLQMLSEESQSCIVLTLLQIRDDLRRLDFQAMDDRIEELLIATTEEED